MVVSDSTVVLKPGNGLPHLVPVKSLHSLEEVGFQEGDLPIREINKEHVEHLAASNLENVPPLKLVSTSRGLGVIDGYHRREAANILKQEMIMVIEGTYASEEAVIEEAFRANLNHGLPASRENRGLYALWLYVHYPEMRQVEIAKRVGISQSAVSQAIKRYEQARAGEDEGENEVTQEAYNKAMLSYADRFTKSLVKFYENEVAFFGSLDGERSERKRAKGIADSITSPTHTHVNAMRSIARSMYEAANLVQARLKS